MDIGHFCFCPKSRKLFLRSGIDVPQGALKVEQFVKSIIRIEAQANVSYESISKVAFGNLSTDQAWADFFVEGHNLDINQTKTLQ
jgi:hypothetical protein